MDEEFITVEIDDDGCGRLRFELPLDVTEHLTGIDRPNVTCLEVRDLKDLDVGQVETAVLERLNEAASRP